MLKTEGKTSIYYQEDTCEACGGLSHWGELINCRVFNKGDIKTLGYKHIEPNGDRVYKAYIRFYEEAYIK